MELLNERFNFSGANIALFCGNSLLTILRDDKPDIPSPNMWDLPGGGREADETPFECVRREVFEEFGLTLDKDAIDWIRAYTGVRNPDQLSVFIVGTIRQEQIEKIVFVDEGQGYKMMPLTDFFENENVIPQLKTRLRDYLEANR